MPARVRHRVKAILEGHGLRPVPEGDDLVLRFASTAVFVGFFRLGSQIIITLRAPVLSDVDSAPTDAVLRELNRRNCASHFGKWTFHETAQMISVEYDLLGDHLQEDELLTAVAAVARLADSGDDALQKELGTGRRAIDISLP